MSKYRYTMLGLTMGAVFSLLSSGPSDGALPVRERPLVVDPETGQVRIYGRIYPRRYNTADGDEARYHLLVWADGRSPHALIETPADDLEFYEALVRLGSRPGDNLTMKSWTERRQPDSAAPRSRVTGDPFRLRVSWLDKPDGVPIEAIFDPVSAPNSRASFDWRFAGNRWRWFNLIPFAPRPGCLICLYSCPSGKVGNRAVAIADYVQEPGRFRVDTGLLPADGTAVIVTVER